MKWRRGRGGGGGNIYKSQKSKVESRDRCVSLCVQASTARISMYGIEEASRVSPVVHGLRMEEKVQYIHREFRIEKSTYTTGVVLYNSTREITPKMATDRYKERDIFYHKTKTC
jgi:hypothetical protein